jgi:hypothetical protein
MSTTCFPPGAEPRGKTEFERFDDVMKRILAVPKANVAKQKRKSPQKRRKPAAKA